MATYIQMASDLRAVERLRKEKIKRVFAERWEEEIPASLDDLDLRDEGVRNKYFSVDTATNLNKWTSASPSLRDHNLAVVGTSSKAKSKIAVAALKMRVGKEASPPTIGYLNVLWLADDPDMSTERLNKVDYLLLDGLTADPIPEKALVRLRYLADFRFTNGKKNVFATTLNDSQVRESYGESFYGAMYSKTLFAVVKQVSTSSLPNSTLLSSGGM